MISAKKTFLAGAMAVTGLSPLAVRLRPVLRDEIAVLAYHRVMDVANEETYPFDPDLISASIADFAWQMEYIRKHYTPITFRRLLDGVVGKGGLPARPILVTFDDGFDDNYRCAYPVLRALGIPATIFISTGYIGQSGVFWFDWLYYLFNQAAASGRGVLKFAEATFPLDGGSARRRAAIAGLYDHAKRLPDAILRRELSGLEQALGVSCPASGFPQSRPLSWEQVREMAEHGIEFGSHTVTHPVLTNLDDAKLREELAISKERIEHETGQPVDVIAYPVGGEFAFSEKVIGAVREAGYRIGTTYLAGLNNLKTLDLFRLKRLHVERYVGRSYFQAMLAFPEIFG